MKKRRKWRPRSEEAEALEIANRAVAMMSRLARRPIRPITAIRIKRIYGAGGWYYAHPQTITLRRLDAQDGVSYDPTTLAHEIAHHFVHELSSSRQRSHGEFFQRMNEKALALLGLPENL